MIQNKMLDHKNGIELGVVNPIKNIKYTIHFRCLYITKFKFQFCFSYYVTRCRWTKHAAMSNNGLHKTTQKGEKTT